MEMTNDLWVQLEEQDWFSQREKRRLRQVGSWIRRALVEILDPGRAHRIYYIQELRYLEELLERENVPQVRIDLIREAIVVTRKGIERFHSRFEWI